MAALIVAPETVNVCTLEASGKEVLKAERVPVTVMVEEGLTVLLLMDLVTSAAPVLVNLILPP
jgi:hypothetical protein